MNTNDIKIYEPKQESGDCDIRVAVPNGKRLKDILLAAAGVGFAAAAGYMVKELVTGKPKNE